MNDIPAQVRNLAPGRHLVEFKGDVLRWQWWAAGRDPLDRCYLAGFGDKDRASAHGQRHGWMP